MTRREGDTYYTEPDLALAIVRAVAEHMGHRDNMRVLEPAR